jgi:hypothetical protein
MLSVSDMHSLKDDSVSLVMDASRLKDYEGKKVIVEGKISKIYWQHIIDNPRTHPVSSYFDIGNTQIMIYSKKEIECKGRLRIKGTVIKLGGGEKKPNRKETATEYHLVLDDYECLE